MRIKWDSNSFCISELQSGTCEALASVEVSKIDAERDMGWDAELTRETGRDIGADAATCDTLSEGARDEVSCILNEVINAGGLISMGIVLAA